MSAYARGPGAGARGWLDGNLGLLQGLFLLTWIVYVVFLGDLLGQAGLPKDLAPRLLVLDQVVFACMDVLLGIYADRMLNLMRRLAPMLLVVNLVACLIFAGLPVIAGAGPHWLIAATVLWVACSTVLRAPLYGAIARRNARPVRGTAWALAGMGLASAAAPYLGAALKGVDPGLPFLLSAVVLALATLGFGAWERGQPAPAPGGRAARPDLARMAMPVAAMLCVGLGIQLHFFVNAAPLFRQVADAALLTWLMPVFWVGFSLAVHPGARLAAGQGAARAFAASSLVGAAASLACVAGPGLSGLIGLQALAGACWGIGFLAALESAGRSGHQGRESTFVGLMFAALALATALRIGLATGSPLPGSAMRLLAPGLWGLGGVLAAYMAISRRRGGYRHESA